MIIAQGSSVRESRHGKHLVARKIRSGSLSFSNWIPNLIFFFLWSDSSFNCVKIAFHGASQRRLVAESKESPSRFSHLRGELIYAQFKRNELKEILKRETTTETWFPILVLLCFFFSSFLHAAVTEKTCEIRLSKSKNVHWNFSSTSCQLFLTALVEFFNLLDFSRFRISAFTAFCRALKLVD